MDTLGNLIAILVHVANLADTQSGCDMLKGTKQKQGHLEAFSGDEGYGGSAVEFVEKVLGLKLHISKMESGLKRLFRAIEM